MNYGHGVGGAPCLAPASASSRESRMPSLRKILKNCTERFGRKETPQPNAWGTGRRALFPADPVHPVVGVACLLSDFLLLNHLHNPGAKRFVCLHQNREVFSARNGAYLRIGSNGHSQIGKG